MSARRVLVTGGGGYIGSHMVVALEEAGYAPIILDDFRNSAPRIAERLGAPIERGSTHDAALLRDVFARHAPVAVMHFAALAYVGDSVREPGAYFHNNVAGTLTLLEAMREAGVDKFVFSSTCATFGTPDVEAIDEATPQRPINPYGQSKLMVEQILREYDRAHGLRSIALRYFNAAGAHPSARIGERHDPETHIVPLAIRSAMGAGELSIFGDDYPTPDGTCVRDYVHVCDLASAHLLALEALLAGGASDAYNLGTGRGHSVREVVGAVERAVGKPVTLRIAPRRPGDPAVLVANAEKARRVLGWAPRYPTIDAIVETAFRWHARDNLET
ncbi:MAG: UDP-glucose 4-epimerase GalE [Polyangiaceae bacterium]